jgi:serine/threonine protein kinase
MSHDELMRDALPRGLIVRDHTERAYEILDVVNADSDFSIVYLVRDHTRGDDAVLKEFFPHADVRRAADAVAVSPRLPSSAPIIEDALRRFRREADLMKRVTHRNVVRLRGDGSFDAHGTSYVAMDYVHGQTLQSLIARLDVKRRAVPLDPRWSNALLDTLLDALESLHRVGIVHRDLKPANIMVPENGLRGDPTTTMLIDFGSAIELSASTDHRSYEKPETSKSTLRERGGRTRLPFTPEYAPPEIALSQLIKPASDFYSLAATMFELLTGEKPCPASHRQQYVLRDSSDDPQPKLREDEKLAQHYSTLWLDALDQALQLSDRDRPQRVSDFKHLLLREEPVSSPSRPSWVRPVAIGALAVVVLGVLITIMMGSDDSQKFVAEELPAESPIEPPVEPNLDPLPPSPPAEGGAQDAPVNLQVRQPSPDHTAVYIDGKSVAVGETIYLSPGSFVTVSAVAENFKNASRSFEVERATSLTVSPVLCASYQTVVELVPQPDRQTTKWDSVGTAVNVVKGACPAETQINERRAMADRTCSQRFQGSARHPRKKFKVDEEISHKIVSGEVVELNCHIEVECARTVVELVKQPPVERMREVANDGCKSELGLDISG